jgi:hypothetical protein
VNDSTSLLNGSKGGSRQSGVDHIEHKKPWSSTAPPSVPDVLTESCHWTKQRKNESEADFVRLSLTYKPMQVMSLCHHYPPSPKLQFVSVNDQLKSKMKSSVRELIFLNCGTSFKTWNFLHTF